MIFLDAIRANVYSTGSGLSFHKYKEVKKEIVFDLLFIFSDFLKTLSN